MPQEDGDDEEEGIYDYRRNLGVNQINGGDAPNRRDFKAFE